MNAKFIIWASIVLLLFGSVAAQTDRLGSIESRVDNEIKQTIKELIENFGYSREDAEQLWNGAGLGDGEEKFEEWYGSVEAGIPPKDNDVNDEGQIFKDGRWVDPEQGNISNDGRIFWDNEWKSDGDTNADGEVWDQEAREWTTPAEEAAEPETEEPEPEAEEEAAVGEETPQEEPDAEASGDVRDFLSRNWLWILLASALGGGGFLWSNRDKIKDWRKRRREEKETTEEEEKLKVQDIIKQLKDLREQKLKVLEMSNEIIEKKKSDIPDLHDLYWKFLGAKNQIKSTKFYKATDSTEFQQWIKEGDDNEKVVKDILLLELEFEKELQKLMELENGLLGERITGVSKGPKWVVLLITHYLSQFGQFKDDPLYHLREKPLTFLERGWDKVRSPIHHFTDMPEEYKKAVSGMFTGIRRLLRGPPGKNRASSSIGVARAVRREIAEYFLHGSKKRMKFLKSGVLFNLNRLDEWISEKARWWPIKNLRGPAEVAGHFKDEEKFFKERLRRRVRNENRYIEFLIKSLHWLEAHYEYFTKMQEPWVTYTNFLGEKVKLTKEEAAKPQNTIPEAVPLRVVTRLATGKGPFELRCKVDDEYIGDPDNPQIIEAGESKHPEIEFDHDFGDLVFGRHTITYILNSLSDSGEILKTTDTKSIRVWIGPTDEESMPSVSLQNKEGRDLESHEGVYLVLTEEEFVIKVDYSAIFSGPDVKARFADFAQRLRAGARRPGTTEFKDDIIETGEMSAENLVLSIPIKTKKLGNVEVILSQKESNRAMVSVNLTVFDPHRLSFTIVDADNNIQNPTDQGFNLDAGKNYYAVFDYSRCFVGEDPQRDFLLYMQKERPVLHSDNPGVVHGGQGRPQEMSMVVLLRPVAAGTAKMTWGYVTSKQRILEFVITVLAAPAAEGVSRGTVKPEDTPVFKVREAGGLRRELTKQRGIFELKVGGRYYGMLDYAHRFDDAKKFKEYIDRRRPTVSTVDSIVEVRGGTSRGADFVFIIEALGLGESTIKVHFNEDDTDFFEKIRVTLAPPEPEAAKDIEEEVSHLQDLIRQFGDLRSKKVRVNEKINQVHRQLGKSKGKIERVVKKLKKLRKKYSDPIYNMDPGTDIPNQYREEAGELHTLHNNLVILESLLVQLYNLETRAIAIVENISPAPEINQILIELRWIMRSLISKISQYHNDVLKREEDLEREYEKLISEEYIEARRTERWEKEVETEEERLIEIFVQESSMFKEIEKLISEQLNMMEQIEGTAEENVGRATEPPHASESEEGETPPTTDIPPAGEKDWRDDLRETAKKIRAEKRRRRPDLGDLLDESEPESPDDYDKGKLGI